MCFFFKFLSFIFLLIQVFPDPGARKPPKDFDNKLLPILCYGIVFNSRTAIAGAIIGLLLVFFRHDFCYDHMTSQPLFVHSFMQFQLNCMCDVIFRS